jgi:hypothetical protein
MAAIPGPWYRARNEIENRWVYADRPDGTRHIVAKVWADGGGGYESTASLISAAPELLEASRRANQELLDMGQGSSGSPALVALWAAIAKAEGRE